MVDYFAFVYESRKTKPIEIVLRREGGIRENDGGVNYLRYIVSTYINVTIYPPCTTTLC
jgi:hypothetical protein